MESSKLLVSTAVAVALLGSGCSGLQQADPEEGGTTGSDTTMGPVGETTSGDDPDTTGGQGGSGTGASSGTTMSVLDGTTTDDDDDDDDDDDATTTTDDDDDDATTTTGDDDDDATTTTGDDDDDDDDDATTTGGTTTGTTDGTTSGTTGGTSDCPPGIVSFDEAQWSYYSTPNVGLMASNANALTLIEDDVTNGGAAVFYADDLEPPYTIHFEYTIFDDDGAENGNIYASADGLAVIVAKDEDPYGLSAPPPGGDRGFFEDGTGYAVDFSIYETRLIQLRAGNGNVVAGPVIPAISTYPHGEWRDVSVEVDTDSITVTYEGGIELTYNAAIDTTYSRIGFGAGTGAADGQHRIRNVELVCN